MVWACLRACLRACVRARTRSRWTRASHGEPGSACWCGGGSVPQRWPAQSLGSARPNPEGLLRYPRSPALDILLTVSCRLRTSWASREIPLGAAGCRPGYPRNVGCGFLRSLNPAGGRRGRRDAPPHPDWRILGGLRLDGDSCDPQRDQAGRPIGASGIWVNLLGARRAASICGSARPVDTPVDKYGDIGPPAVRRRRTHCSSARPTRAQVSRETSPPFSALQVERADSSTSPRKSSCFGRTRA